MRLANYRGTWCVYWREGNQSKRHSLRTDDKRLAEQRLKDFLKASVRPRETIEDVFTAYMEEKGDAAKWNWKALQPYFGNMRPDQITREACKDYTRQRCRTVKTSTVHRELTALRAAVRWNNPHTTAIFDFPTRPPPKNRYLTKPEARQLIEAACSPHVRLFMILALATAARASALLELTWDRVDLDRRLIHLANGEADTNKRRAIVPINDIAMEAINAARPAAVTDYVIEWGARRVLNIKKGVGRAAERAGLAEVSPHVLRHTAAVWMAESGVPMSEIAQYLGHSSTAVTERVYARYSPDYLRGAARALEF